MSAFADLVDDFFRDYWKLHPIEASAAGVGEQDAELGDLTRRGFAERESFAKAWERRLTAVREAELAPGERIDRDVLLAELRGVIALAPSRPWARQPWLYVSAIVEGAEVLLLREDQPLAERVATIAQRMTQARAVVDAALANLDADATPPVHVVVAGEAAAAGAKFLRAYLPSVAPEGPAKRDILLAGQEAAVALDRFALWLRDDLMRRARGTFAIGRDALEALLRRHHLLRHDAVSLLRVAKNVFEETRAGLADEARAAGDERWEATVERLKADHPSADELLDAYRAAVAQARAATQGLGLVPFPGRDELDVVETPEFLRTTVAFARYVAPAPFAARRKGYLQVTLPDTSWPAKDVEHRLRGHPRAGIPLLVAQQTYPGTHLQLSHAAEHPSPVRKAFRSAVAVGGWAVHAAELVTEAGAVDPATRVLALRDLLWRAARVIVDVGLATGEMNFEQAVSFLVEGPRLEPPSAVAETRRYTLAPAEALADLVGYVELRALRERAAARGLGAKEFHARLLGAAAIPAALAARELGLNA